MASNAEPDTKIKRPKWRVVKAHIIGEPPGLLMDAWYEKKTASSTTDDETAVEKALWALNPPTNGCAYGIPAAAFQDAFCQAARWTSKQGGLTWARGVIRVVTTRSDGMVPIQEKGYETYRRAVNTQKSGRHMKESPVFGEWAADVIVSYRADELTVEDLSTLIMIAGQSVGVGGLAPRHKCSGPYGRFTAKSVTEDRSDRK